MVPQLDALWHREKHCLELFLTDSPELASVTHVALIPCVGGEASSGVVDLLRFMCCESWHSGLFIGKDTFAFECLDLTASPPHTFSFLTVVRGALARQELHEAKEPSASTQPSAASRDHEWESLFRWRRVGRTAMCDVLKGECAVGSARPPLLAPCSSRSLPPPPWHLCPVPAEEEGEALLYALSTESLLPCLDI